MTEPKPSTGACEHYTQHDQYGNPIWVAGGGEFESRAKKCPYCKTPSPSESPTLMAPNTAEIRRYDFNGKYLETFPLGEYVLWADHLAALTAEKEKLADLFDEISGKNCCGDFCISEHERRKLESQLHDRDALIESFKDKDYFNTIANLTEVMKEKDSRIALLMQEPSYQQGYNDCWKNAVKPRNKELKGLEKELAEANLKLDEAYKIRFQVENHAAELTGDFAKKTVVLKAEVTKLRAALEKYGKHKRGCPEPSASRLLKNGCEVDLECECGLYEALAQVEKC